MLLALFFIAALSSTSFADSAIERCEVSHCTCRVFESRNVQKTNIGKMVKVYFEEDSYELTALAKKNLLDYFANSTGSLYISGYADQCGDANHNADLSRDRALTVKNLAPFGRVRSTKYYGESSSVGHTQHDRKVVVSTRSDPLSRAMDAIPADVYIIDASESIGDHWSEITSYDFPSGSAIYLSKMISCKDGTFLDQNSPGGGTEIWYTYYHVLDYMNSGETLLIISDFNSNVALSKSEIKTIEDKAKNKNVIVRSIKY
jgi:hypothetical protein